MSEELGQARETTICTGTYQNQQYQNGGLTPAMWAKTFEKFEREIREEGRKAGERQGRKEGGAANLLLRQLERKFGPLDARTRARIHRAGPDRLLEWGERFVTAERLEQVFEG